MTVPYCYIACHPNMANPGVVKCFLNFVQALSLWQFTSGPYAGQTLDQCAGIERILIADEYSFNPGRNPPSGHRL